MPLIPDFTVSQTPGSPTELTVADTSSGSDVLVTSRRVYLKTNLNVWLVPDGVLTDYVPWPLVDTSIGIDCLDKDYALLIRVDWLDVSNNVVYSKPASFGLTGHNEDFDYGLTQMLTANPENIGDDSFFENKSALRNYIDSGDNAVERASDIFAAQVCYDKGTTLRLKSRYNFNINS